VITNTVVESVNAVEHFDNRPDVDIESGLLLDFAFGRVHQCLTKLDAAAGQRPLALPWLMRALDE
jgi:hypothetical protein